MIAEIFLLSPFIQGASTNKYWELLNLYYKS